MTNRVALLFTFGALVAAPPLLGDESLKPPVQVTSTDRVDFAPGGVIRVNGSYGDLYVEGWDQPQVEITVRKFMPYENPSAHSERSSQRLEAVHVAAERRSPSELAISTSLPPHQGLPGHPTSPSRTGNVGIEYQIHVPRASRLVIHHGVGLVSVTDVTGDIEAACHRGDIVLWLRDTGIYSIDAKSKLGKVSSDFTGDSFSEFLVGQKFESVHPPPSQRLSLHVGFGGITIKPILPESEAKRRSLERAK
jgi:hypothetical protein